MVSSMSADANELDGYRLDAYKFVRRSLLCAESALRRLIVIAARGVTVRQRAGQGFPTDLSLAVSKGRGFSFPLYDARLNTQIPVQAISPVVIGNFDAPRCAVRPTLNSAQHRIDPAALLRRLERLKQALETLPKQAKRLARSRLKQSGYVRRPMRPGRPPGFRQRSSELVDDVLKDLQELALLSYCDTS